MLQEVLQLARRAGREIMEVYNAVSIQQQNKSDGSPLTEADMVSHNIIVAGLQRLTPCWPVLSEESSDIGYNMRKDWNRFWLVDPLDGTKEFLKRNGEFTVNIALIEDGRPVSGVVHAPALGVSYFAEKGRGACKQCGDNAPVAIRVSQCGMGERLRIVGSRSHADARQDDLVTHLGGGEFHSMGSSLKLCLVADGSAHIYPRLGPTMEWDTAAAHSIVLESGGVVCDRFGEDLRYNKEDLHNASFVVTSIGDMRLRAQVAVWKW